MLGVRTETNINMECNALLLSAPSTHNSDTREIRMKKELEGKAEKLKMTVSAQSGLSICSRKCSLSRISGKQCYGLYIKCIVFKLRLGLQYIVQRKGFGEVTDHENSDLVSRLTHRWIHN
jgi:hypothetical protein